MDRLQLINIFVTVVDTGGFAGAARKLNVSPPVVTRAINELEAHLGVRLLTRTTRVVRVTEAGARYAEDCRVILAQLSDADEAVGGLHSVPRGRLTVTAPVGFGAMYVTPVVTEYLSQYPDVNVSCWFMDRLVNMLDEGVDIGVRIGELPDSSMQAIRVGKMSDSDLRHAGLPGPARRAGVARRSSEARDHRVQRGDGHFGVAHLDPRSAWRRQGSTATDLYHCRRRHCRGADRVRPDQRAPLQGGRPPSRRPPEARTR